MTATFHLWCDTDEDGGPETGVVSREDGVPGLRLEPGTWSDWLLEHREHDLHIILETPAGALGLPVFRATRGGIQFVVRTPEEVECAAAWSDYRKEYGVSVSRSVREQEHAAFKAGWAAARGTADTGGVQR